MAVAFLLERRRATVFSFFFEQDGIRVPGQDNGVSRLYGLIFLVRIFWISGCLIWNGEWVCVCSGEDDKRHKVTNRTFQIRSDGKPTRPRKEDGQAKETRARPSIDRYYIGRNTRFTPSTPTPCVPHPFDRLGTIPAPDCASTVPLWNLPRAVFGLCH
ncbi:hypothetical protein VTJ04DRAFT_2400 [Mycothermus thermophilus]|uniref:uncharacterized protein n=1 Tax=Humicola insolens TaxID=85995 RepID=UPI00374230FF